MDRRALLVTVSLLTIAALSWLTVSCPDMSPETTQETPRLSRDSTVASPAPAERKFTKPSPITRAPALDDVTPQLAVSGTSPGFAPLGGTELPRLAQPAAPQQRSDFIELLVELRIDRGPAVNVLAMAGSTLLLLPVRSFLDLAEIATDSTSAGNRMGGVLHPSGHAYLIDPEQAAAQVGERRIPIGPEQVYWRDGELFLATDLLETVFSVRFLVNLSELAVLVRQTDHLPVIRRLERERRRIRATAGQRVEDESSGLAIRHRAFSGAVLDWAVSSATESPLRTSSAEIGIGAQVLGGSAVLRHKERRLPDQHYRTTTGSWIRVWQNISWLRQVRLGEVLGTGPQPRVVRGAAITNSPLVRPATFGFSPLVGVLPQGWEVELYRGNQFVDFTTTDASGRYRFEVPVQYGDNPLDLFAYGPNGEIVRHRRTFSIAAERFAAGQFEYGVGAGTCVFDPCQATANLDLRYGIDDRWTVRGGFERFWRDTLPDVWHAYTSTVFQATRALALSAEAVSDALATGRVEYAPTQDLRVVLAHTAFFGNVVAPLIGSTHESHRTEAALFFRPAFWNYATFAQLTALRSVGSDRSRDLVRVVASGRFNGVRLDIGAAHERMESGMLPPTRRSTVDVRYFQSYRGSLQWLRRTLVKAEFRTDLGAGPLRVSGGLIHGFRDLVQLDAGVVWQKGLGVSLELGLSATLRSVRAVSRNQIAPDGTHGLQLAEGSVLWDGAARRVAFADGRSLGRAGITGVVFLDADGDGLADPDEMRVQDVLIIAGPSAVRTDSEGRFAVWDLVPFEPVVLEVAEESIRDPLLVAATPRVMFRPDPNSFTPVPIPLVRTGEVAGQVLVGSDERPLRGATVVLVSLDTGDEYTATTFSDGAFYVLGVRPGSYEVSIPDDLLRQLNLHADPAQFEVGSSRETAIVDGILVRARHGQ